LGKQCQYRFPYFHYFFQTIIIAELTKGHSTVSTSSAWADLIGINIQGRGLNNDATNNAANALTTADVAGVMPQANWNNDATMVGSSGTHTLSQLVDSTGTHTSVSLSVNANDSWFSGTAQRHHQGQHESAYRHLYVQRFNPV
jgi:hypothetical protein